MDTASSVSDFYSFDETQQSEEIEQVDPTSEVMQSLQSEEMDHLHAHSDHNVSSSFCVCTLSYSLTDGCQVFQIHVTPYIKQT